MARLRRLPKLAGRAAAKQPVSKTGYQAQGIAQAPQLDSELGSALPSVVREIVPELASSYSRLLTYTKMMNDAGVDVSMRAAKTPILGADFFIEPYGNDDQDLVIAQFVQDNLMGGMSSPFLNSLEDILHFFEDGYAVLEKVYENRQWSPNLPGANNKQYTMLKDLSVRPPSTLTDITYDNNGNPVQIVQNAIQGDKTTAEKQLKADKLLIFTFNRNGGDLTGKSLLRTAYPHWYYKTHFYKIDAIQKERNSLGVPKGKLMAGYTPNDKKILRNLLANLRSNEEAFMVLPPNVDVEFAEVKNNPVDVLASADHHNIQILMNVMAQFLALGVEGHGGGRATGGSQTDIYMKALRYVANYIVDVINMYLIPELVVYNFPTNNFPKLQVRNMGETRDLQMLGSALANLFSQGALTTDIDTENWMRRVFDMPLKRADVAAVDPNARQQQAVTLYDGSGNAIKAVPVNGNAPANNNGGNPQQGAPKQNGGQGNVGKPATSAFSESHIHLPAAPQPPQIEHHVPVDVENHYEFTTPPVEVRFDEGAIVAPAPIVHIHMSEQEVKEQKPTSSKIIRAEDGTITGVEYEYGADS